jgi:hypothetical protein
MTIAITGASGLIGTRLMSLLRDHGEQTRAISTRGVVRTADIEGCDAVVNLAGEPVAQRWTAAAKERIRSSRVDGTRRVVKALAGLKKPPEVLVSASAIGIYGSRGDETLTESSLPAEDFLGEVTTAWELAAREAEGRVARQAETPGIRVVILRFGVILASDGGALKKMLPPFKLGIGGRIGSGQQWMSWIHIDDVTRLIAFAVANESVHGAVNAVAPYPVRNVDFTRELAGAVHRPAILPVPIVALRMLFGPMAEILAGFEFKFAELGAALRDLV